MKVMLVYNVSSLLLDLKLSSFHFEMFFTSSLVKETSALAMAAMTETRIRNFIFVFAWCCWLGKLESSQVTVI